MTGIPRLVIAGTHSGVGKTTVATALMAALTRRGMCVQPFKIGPDFIDPAYHRVACGRASRNLDGWMLSRETNLEIFERATRDADIAVVEGVMGLFDGRDAATDAGSTAEMAKWLHAPVVLVADASAIARSAAALVRGFEEFDRALDLAGTLFNFVGGTGHANILRDAVAAHCRAKPAGFLPRVDAIEIAERHLGLVMPGDVLNSERLNEMAGWIGKNVDLDSFVALARQHSAPLPSPAISHSKAPAAVRIGVARDAAFCFYYQDNLDLLAECGAEIVDFSPIAHAAIPDGVDGLYFGGGYPEIHAETLSKNEPMRRSIAEFARSGGPIYAECGGLMYLTKEIVDCDGRVYPMIGLFPSRVTMQNRLAALAYVEAEVATEAPWLRAGQRVRGHEFHYSTLSEMPEVVKRCLRFDANGSKRQEGYSMGSALATFAHFHFCSMPDFARQFVRACSDYRSRMPVKEGVKV